MIKGHATDEHVAKGIITAIHKEGNNIADACANIGVKCHGEGMNYLASAYNKRHGLYTVFMTKVVKHIVEAHMIHRELIRIAGIKDSNSNSSNISSNNNNNTNTNNNNNNNNKQTTTITTTTITTTPNTTTPTIATTATPITNSKQQITNNE